LVKGSFTGYLGVYSCGKCDEKRNFCRRNCETRPIGKRPNGDEKEQQTKKAEDTEDKATQETHQVAKIYPMYGFFSAFLGETTFLGYDNGDSGIGSII